MNATLPNANGLAEVRIEPIGQGYLLVARQFVPLSTERVYSFFAQPQTLARIMPPWLNLQAVNAPDQELRRGMRLEYTLRWLGTPIRWEAVISACDPPRRLEDTQVRGPFTGWVHEHHFHEANGGTWVEDRVHYRLPFGALARPVHDLIVGPQLRETFEYRARRTDELLRLRSGIPSAAPAVQRRRVA